MKNIALDFGKVGTWNDGLGVYSTQLGEYIYSLIDEIRDSGFDVYFCLPEKWIGFFGDNVKYIKYTSLHRHVNIRAKYFHLWHSLHQHVSLRPPLLSGVKLATIHDLNFIYSSDLDAKEKARDLEKHKKFASRYTNFIGISDYVVSDIKKYLGEDLDVHRIYNGVKNLTEINELHPKKDIKEGFFLHISRMAPSKNINSIVDLALAMPDESFIFTGPFSSDVENLINKIKGMQINNIKILCDVSEAEKSWLLRRCKAFIFPSLTEGFGIPPVEAMYFGKPIFLSKFTALPEIGGAAAYYFDDYSPESMLQVVKNGLINFSAGNKSRDMESRANLFSVNKFGGNYLSLYMSLLGAKNARVLSKERHPN